MKSMLLLLAPCIVLATIAYAYTTRAPALARMAKWQLLFIGSSAVGLFLTFVAAALNRPLVDATIAAADSAMGFDWTSAVAYVGARPLLSHPLIFAYSILIP